VSCGVRYTAKSIDITNKKGDTKPVDLVFQSIAPSFQCFTCSLDVSLAITLSAGQSPRDQIEVLRCVCVCARARARWSIARLTRIVCTQAALERETEALRKGLVLVNRTVVDEDAPICGNKKSGGSASFFAFRSSFFFSLCLLPLSSDHGAFLSAKGWLT
jgi:hypothetical protein